MKKVLYVGYKNEPHIENSLSFSYKAWYETFKDLNFELRGLFTDSKDFKEQNIEVTDIANAVYEGADAVMLSGETSIGKYPEECIKFMKSIVAETEKFKTLGYENNLQKNSDWEYIGQAAKNLAESIKADGIIAITRTGDTATYIANAKPHGVPIFSFTNKRRQTW